MSMQSKQTATSNLNSMKLNGPNPEYLTLSKALNKNKDEFNFHIRNDSVGAFKTTTQNLSLNKSNINNLSNLNSLNKKSIKLSSGSHPTNNLLLNTKNNYLITNSGASIKKRDLFSILSPKTKNELLNLNIVKKTGNNNYNNFSYSTNKNNNETLIEQINLNLNMNNVNNVSVNNYNHINANINPNMNLNLNMNPSMNDMSVIMPYKNEINNNSLKRNASTGKTPITNPLLYSHQININNLYPGVNNMNKSLSQSREKEREGERERIHLTNKNISIMSNVLNVSNIDMNNLHIADEDKRYTSNNQEVSSHLHGMDYKYKNTNEQMLPKTNIINNNNNHHHLNNYLNSNPNNLNNPNCNRIQKNLKQRMTAKSLIISNEVDLNKSLTDYYSPKYTKLIDSLKFQFNEIIGDRSIKKNIDDEDEDNDLNYYQDNNNNNYNSVSNINYSNVNMNVNMNSSMKEPITDVTNMLEKNNNQNDYSKINLSPEKIYKKVLHAKKYSLKFNNICMSSPKKLTESLPSSNNSNLNVSSSQKTLEKTLNNNYKNDIFSLDTDKSNEYRASVTTPGDNGRNKHHLITQKLQNSSLIKSNSNSSYSGNAKENVRNIENTNNSNISNITNFIPNQKVKNINANIVTSNIKKNEKPVNTNIIITTTENVPDNLLFQDKRFIDLSEKMNRINEENKFIKEEEINLKFTIDVMKSYLKIQEEFIINREKLKIEKYNKYEIDNFKEKSEIEKNAVIKENNELKLTILKILYQVQNYENEENNRNYEANRVMSQLLKENEYLRSVSENVIAGRINSLNINQSKSNCDNSFNENEVYTKKYYHKRTETKITNTIHNSLNNSINLNKSNLNISQEIRDGTTKDNKKDMDLFRLTINDMKKTMKKTKHTQVDNKKNPVSLPSDKEVWSNRLSKGGKVGLCYFRGRKDS